jgi:hypothetical protein
MAAHKLTVGQINAAIAAKRRQELGDGHGLVLRVAASGSAQWIGRYSVKNGKRVEMGLGGYPTVDLTAAREKSADARRLALGGKDPTVERVKRRLDEMRAGKSFPEVAEEFIAMREVRPIRDDDAAASFEDGGLRPECTDGDVTDAAECFRAIGGGSHDDSVKERDIRRLISHRPGEAGSAVCPVYRQQVMRPQLDFSASTAIKNAPSNDKTVAHKGSRVWKVILDPLQQNLRDSGIDATVIGDFTEDVPPFEDVVDPTSIWRAIDLEPCREDELLVRGEQVRRGSVGTVIRHLVLLCR